MAVIYLFRLIFFVMFVGGIVLAIKKAVNNYDSSGTSTSAGLRVYVPVVLLGLFGLSWSMSATHVGATHVAVVENTATGSIKVIGPGLHLWPFQPNLVPFSSKVTDYDLRNKRVEIGTDDKSPGIEAGSNSPGFPAVYIKARAWAAPDRSPDSLVALHRKFGPDFSDEWVERNLVEAAKSVQGQHGYDYLIANRDKMAIEIQEAVQRSLTVEGRQLAVVSEVAITDFNYSPETNARLTEVAQKEFDRQKAQKDAAIATEEAVAQRTRADTAVELAVKNGQAEIAKATSEAEANRQRYSDSALSAAYLRNRWIEKWDGKLPTYITGDESNQLIQIPTEAAPR